MKTINSSHYKLVKLETHRYTGPAGKSDFSSYWLSANSLKTVDHRGRYIRSI